MTKQYAGFILGDHLAACGTQMHKTQIPNLSIAVMRPLDGPIKGLLDNSVSIDLSVDSQARSAYLTITSQMRTGTSLLEIRGQLCEIERALILTQVRLLSEDDTGVHAVELFGPGHRVQVRGAVAYIAKCPMVEVQLRDMENCTLDIPVTYEGNPVFVNPITLEITETGRFTICDPVNPVMWRLGSSWICSLPGPMACEAPHQLVPIITKNITEQINLEGLTGGLYTEAQWSRHREAIRVGNSRDAIVSEIYMNAAGYKTGSLGVAGLLAVQDMPTVTHIVGSSIVPFFGAFGGFCSGVIGVLAILWFLVTLISTIARAWLTKERYGRTTAILASCWPAILELKIVRKIWKHTLEHQGTVERDDLGFSISPPMSNRPNVRIPNTRLHMNDFILGEAGELIPKRPMTNPVVIN